MCGLTAIISDKQTELSDECLPLGNPSTSGKDIKHTWGRSERASIMTEEWWLRRSIYSNRHAHVALLYMISAKAAILML